MLSLWNYLRVRANEAICAGVMDALEKIEKGDIGNHHLESSLSLHKKLNEKPSRTKTELGDNSDLKSLGSQLSLRSWAKKRTR